MFIFVGYDMIVSVICWVFYLLLKYFEVLEKVRVEYDVVFGFDLNVVVSVLCVKLELINVFIYINVVMKEVMRVYINVGIMWRGEFGFYFIGLVGSGYDGVKFFCGEGWVVWDNIFVLYRDLEQWLRVYEFILERFLIMDENDFMYLLKNGWRFFEFGLRNCIGQYLVMVEIKMVLVLVLWRLDVKVVWDEWDVKRCEFYLLSFDKVINMKLIKQGF